jgi:hypothetical protein
VKGYRASATGEIQNWKTKRILKHGLNQGYLQVSVDGKTKRVHTLVCLAFHGLPPSSIHTVNHKNGKKDDNREVNLEWATPKEQINHALDMGLFKCVRIVVQTRHTWNQIVVHPSLAKAAAVANCSTGAMIKRCQSGEMFAGSTWAFKEPNLAPVESDSSAAAAAAAAPASSDK